MYTIKFRNTEDAQQFIEYVNGLGCEWHPVHLDNDGKLYFECSESVFNREIRDAYFLA